MSSPKPWSAWIEDVSRPQEIVVYQHSSNETVDEAAQQRMTQSDVESSRFVELCKLHAAAALQLDKGDTLVFIDFPEPPKDQPWQSDCFSMVYRSQQVRVHSEKLMATGSSKFADMLQPAYQARVQRRSRLESLPDGVKYVLDLTPPSEGDELVFQVTQLSLTPGIIKWWAAEVLQGVDSALVAGHDDVCNCNRPPQEEEGVSKEPPASKEQPNSDETAQITRPTMLRLKAARSNHTYNTPAFRNIPDYCPIRHRSNIIRLLMIIEGKSVILDSANRVWTLAALAKIFDCTSAVRDQVAQWIMYGNNTRFIEVLPEEALQIGFALELFQVTQCAFRILVNELAIKEAATTKPLRDVAQTTVFGRRLGSLEDELSNIVQHAARALVERITSLRNELRSQDSLDLWGIGEWAKLRQMEKVLEKEGDDACATARRSLRILMNAIKSTISSGLYERHPNCSLATERTYGAMDDDRASYVQPKDFETIKQVMERLNLVQRLLCPFIYQELCELWEKDHLFYSHAVEIPEARGAYLITYTTLAREFEYSMEYAARMNPSKAATEAWALFFGDGGPGDDASEPRVKIPLVDLDALNTEIKAVVLPFAFSWMRHYIEPPLNMTRHMLLTLTNNEMKFLPLWAGGCNDGTGGVFETEVPPAEMGPNGPGPGYHTGITVPSAPSTVSGSLLEDMSAMSINGSTVAGSVDVQDGISTVNAPGHAIADDASTTSETFDADGTEYQEARFEVPAEHQGTGQAVNMTVESLSDVESLSTITDQGFETDHIVEAEENEKSDSEDSMVLV